MIDPDDALARLRQGNERFRSGESRPADISPGSRSALVAAQKPFAIVLGCSDSRVPAELVFDQGLGDLFVIRVAGNVVAPSQIGSIEFAAETFGTRLVVVMGHSHCGAVQATLDQLRQPTESRSPNLHAIVDRIRPGLEPLLANAGEVANGELLVKAVRANIQASVDKLMHGSEILERLVASGQLKIVGAEYCLESGVVDFF